jgi:hypothetical protein
MTERPFCVNSGPFSLLAGQYPLMSGPLLEELYERTHRSEGHETGCDMVAAFQDVEIEPRFPQPHTDQRIADSLDGRHGGIPSMGILRRA